MKNNKCKHDGYFTTTELGRIYSRSYLTCYRMCKDGVFPNVFVCKQCRKHLVPRKDIVNHINSIGKEYE